MCSRTSLQLNANLIGGNYQSNRYFIYSHGFYLYYEFKSAEYIIAVDTHRHFVKAAEKCFITQATLSMMIKKLEEELDLVIFDRSKKPVVPTQLGKKIIAQAKIIVQESQKLKEIVSTEQNSLSENCISELFQRSPLTCYHFSKFILKNTHWSN
ncbi:MAG: LysR family transcriptional regulator [Saprospiraceae bacterium]|nr:LysR family transcriptional regulator [Candidatus Vicinibacter affinis]